MLELYLRKNGPSYSSPRTLYTNLLHHQLIPLYFKTGEKKRALTLVIDPLRDVSQAVASD